MKISIASDHRGLSAKRTLSIFMQENGHEVDDKGAHGPESCDYTDVAYKASSAVSSGDADMGVLICGSGIGMSISANKVNGVRAALCHDELSAELSRRHNNANVLCLASDVLGEELMRRIVANWLRTDFEGEGRHGRRVRKITCIEEGQDPATITD